MHEGFVPLHSALRPQQLRENEETGEVQPPKPVHATVSQASCSPGDVGRAIAAARRFGAALADALALSLERLLRDIAYDVLARELALAPCDVATIAARALNRYLDEEPVRVRVHPDEVTACATLDVGIVGDPSLRIGDAVLEVRCGSIDASLEARLEAVLM